MAKAPPLVGQDFGRTDMERLGFFAEMGYLVGVRYTPNLELSNIRDLKKRQMFPGSSKVKSALQDGYFEEFKRLFIGEGYPRKKKRDKKKAEAADRPFIPSSLPKPLYRPGDAYGYFSHCDAFSPRADEDIPPTEPRGIYTNPTKMGGPGYVDTGINRYPDHIPEEYEPKPILSKIKILQTLPLKAVSHPTYFEKNPYYDDSYMPHYKKLKEKYIGKIIRFIPPSPAKKDGGCHAGTIERFPEYISDKYYEPYKIDKVLEKIKEKKMRSRNRDKVYTPFVPTPCCKTWQCHSIMKKKVEMNTHVGNWIDMKPITYTQKFTSI